MGVVRRVQTRLSCKQFLRLCKGYARESDRNFCLKKLFQLFPDGVGARSPADPRHSEIPSPPPTFSGFISLVRLLTVIYKSLLLLV